MNPPFPTGYLSTIQPLPKSAKPRQCRYCRCEVVAANTRPVCKSDECRARLRAERAGKQRRYQRRYDAKRRAS